jgi:hypothetical protein
MDKLGMGLRLLVVGTLSHAIVACGDDDAPADDATTPMPTSGMGDASMNMPDAGETPDASTGSDAGSMTDAATMADAGSDAGDSGPDCSVVSNPCSAAGVACDGTELVTCAADADGCLVETVADCTAAPNNFCEATLATPACAFDA